MGQTQSMAPEARLMNTVSDFFELGTPCELAVIQDMIVEEPGRAFGIYADVRVTGRFQRVFSLRRGRPEPESLFRFAQYQHRRRAHCDARAGPAAERPA